MEKQIQASEDCKGSYSKKLFIDFSMTISQFSMTIFAQILQSRYFVEK